MRSITDSLLPLGDRARVLPWPIPKDDYFLERQLQSEAERSQCAEGRPTTTREEIAQGPLVDVRVLCQIPASPTAEDSRPVDRGSVDQP
jgi:hypothetical protein